MSDIEEDLWARESVSIFSYPLTLPSGLHELYIRQGREHCASLLPTCPSHGHHVWDAALLLSEVLQHSEFLSVLSLPSWSSLNVIELGSGTGVPGLTCAALGAVKVTLTDQAYCLPLLSLNVQHNKSLWTSTTPEVQELEWGTPTVLGQSNDMASLIIASDILYSVGSFPKLWTTLQTLSPSACTTIILATETRNVKVENQFWDTALEYGFRWRSLDDNLCAQAIAAVQKKSKYSFDYGEDITLRIIERV